MLSSYLLSTLPAILLDCRRAASGSGRCVWRSGCPGIVRKGRCQQFSPRRWFDGCSVIFALRVLILTTKHYILTIYCYQDGNHDVSTVLDTTSWRRLVHRVA